MASILYVPQLSMYDKNTKKLLPQADGNINMMRNTINEWKKNRPDDRFYVLIPEEIFIPYIDLKIPCKYLTYKNSVVSARINRFNFPMAEYINIFKKLDINFDLILNDIVELTGNFEQMFNIEFGYTPKIISNIRHLDDSVNQNYMWRVLEGIIRSDLVTILSESMKEKLSQQIRHMIGTCGNLLNRVHVFEPSISSTEIEPYTYNAVVKEINKAIITFPGRLAKGEERRTNWDKFEKAIYQLRQKRKDFEVYFTDPNNAMDFYEERWIKTIQKDRNQFLNLLNKTDVVVSLMDVEGFGGISIREALLFGCLPVIPQVHEYRKMAPTPSYSGFIDSPIEVDDLVSALNWAISKAKRRERTEHNTKATFRHIGKQFTIEEQFKKLLPKLEELLNG